MPARRANRKEELGCTHPSVVDITLIGADHQTSLCRTCDVRIEGPKFPRSEQVEYRYRSREGMSANTLQSLLLPTYSGQLVHLLDPDPATIRIIDIVHSLSGLPRYLRHTIRTYSVMEHSLRLAMAARTLGMSELVPECLLHDAHEAYLAELPRMIKHSNMMADYRAVEDNFDRVIRTKYGLPSTPSPWVKRMDRAICRLEIAQLFANPEIVGHSGNGTVEDAAILAEAMKGSSHYFGRYGWSDDATASRTLAFIDRLGLWKEDYFA